MTLPRIPRLAALVAVALVAVSGVLVATPASGAPAKKAVTLTITKLPGQVRLIPGERVKVELSTNRTTGYSWSTKVVGKKGTVTVSDGTYVAPVTTLVGAPGTTTWIVTAMAPGTAVVTFLATPPGGGTPTNDGSLTVIVK